MHESFVTETTVVVAVTERPRNSKDIRNYLLVCLSVKLIHRYFAAKPLADTECYIDVLPAGSVSVPIHLQTFCS